MSSPFLSISLEGRSPSLFIKYTHLQGDTEQLCRAFDEHQTLPLFYLPSLRLLQLHFELLRVHLCSMKLVNPRWWMQLLSNQRRQGQRQRQVAASPSAPPSSISSSVSLYLLLLLLLLLRPQRASALPVSFSGNGSRLLLELLQILDSPRRSCDEVSRPF
jgi:hypothetical protein